MNEWRNPDKLNFAFWQYFAAPFAVECAVTTTAAQAASFGVKKAEEEEEDVSKSRLYSLSRIRNSVSMTLRCCRFPSSRWVRKL